MGNVQIPDGAYCLFVGSVAGAREGRIVLAQLHELVDPETNARFTVKRYHSDKDRSGRNLVITLKPDNPAFEPIPFPLAHDGLGVIAEMVEVLGA